MRHYKTDLGFRCILSLADRKINRKKKMLQLISSTADNSARVNHGYFRPLSNSPMTIIIPFWQIKNLHRFSKFMWQILNVKHIKVANCFSI